MKQDSGHWPHLAAGTKPPLSPASPSIYQYTWERFWPGVDTRPTCSTSLELGWGWGHTGRGPWHLTVTDWNLGKPTFSRPGLELSERRRLCLCSF